jgi:hypothetical protein
LRRLLGAAAIATILAIAQLPVEGDDAAAEQAASRERSAESADEMSAGNLPARVPDIYGRDDDCLSVRDSVRRRPLVSIVGAAGIGKSALALTVASQVAVDHPDGAWLVELASLNDPRLLAQTIAQAMRLTLPGLREASDELGAATRGLKALVVLDNETPARRSGPSQRRSARFDDAAVCRHQPGAVCVADECVFRVPAGAGRRQRGRSRLLRRGAPVRRTRAFAPARLCAR